jgi:hypothetical protein
MDLYLCPPKVDLRGLSVTKGVITLQMQYKGLYCFKDKDELKQAIETMHALKRAS